MCLFIVAVIWCKSKISPISLFSQISAMNFLLICHFLRENSIWNGKVKTKERKYILVLYLNTQSIRCFEMQSVHPIKQKYLIIFLVFSIRLVKLTEQPVWVLCRKLIAVHFNIGETGTYSVQQFIFPNFPNQLGKK